MVPFFGVHQKAGVWIFIYSSLLLASSHTCTCIWSQMMGRHKETKNQRLTLSQDHSYSDWRSLSFSQSLRHVGPCCPSHHCRITWGLGHETMEKSLKKENYFPPLTLNRRGSPFPELQVRTRELLWELSLC